MRNLSHKRQRGISTLPVLFGIIVLGFITQNITLRLLEREEQIVADSVSSSIMELVKAQARFTTDPANPAFGTYSASPESLVTSGYLPNWRTNSDYGFSFPATGLQVSYIASNTSEAAEIALRFGQLSSLTGNTVTVGFADPMDLSLFDVFVEKTGDTMSGGLAFQAGSGANIDLNQNAIVDAGSVSVTNTASTGLVEANIVTSDTAIFQDLRIAE
jgi:hypothetical protein